MFQVNNSFHLNFEAGKLKFMLKVYFKHFENKQKSCYNGYTLNMFKYTIVNTYVENIKKKKKGSVQSLCLNLSTILHT